jgi:3,4-dihydroxy-2-butanone 4-phosphate synthase
MLRNEPARTKGTIQKALKYSRMVARKKGRYDNNISTAVQRAKVACKIHASAQAAEQKMLTDRESQMGTNLFYIPGHKVSLSENAVPTAVVRPQKGGKTARREK